MEYAAKLAVGLVVGLLVYFGSPGKQGARPIPAAVMGLLGAFVGAYVAQVIPALGGSDLNWPSVGTAAAGALAFSLAYVGFLSGG
jgi:uncharacterized membrane protein YeaQ/YmgE (transglycosylase-associated protein family)